MSWETRHDIRMSGVNVFNIERARMVKELKWWRGEAELVENTRRVGLGGGEGGVVRRNQSVPV